MAIGFHLFLSILLVKFHCVSELSLNFVETRFTEKGPKLVPSYSDKACTPMIKFAFCLGIKEDTIGLDKFFC